MGDTKVELNIYDAEEIHHNCTVQILTNSVTGEQSIEAAVRGMRRLTDGTT